MDRSGVRVKAAPLRLVVLVRPHREPHATGLGPDLRRDDETPLPRTNAYFTSGRNNDPNVRYHEFSPSSLAP